VTFNSLLRSSLQRLLKPLLTVAAVVAALQFSFEILTATATYCAGTPHCGGTLQFSFEILVKILIPDDWELTTHIPSILF